MNAPTFVKQGAHALPDLADIKRALEQASDPGDVRQIERQLDAAEAFMKQAGLYSTAEIRPVNEARMWARWKLGRLLADVERGAGPGRGKKISQAGKSFLDYLKQIELDKNRAQEAQRIGTLPDADIEKALTKFHKDDTLCTFAYLIDVARPYWYQASRQRRHRTIQAQAKAVVTETIGPFPLIYADPPWKFETYSEKGLDRTPDQHYPTLTDTEIINFRVAGKLVSEIAARDAVLLLWYTSSNLVRAQAVMEAWGFTYKTHAVWVKDRSGTGLVFRNRHEPLLYGIRGSMPGPQWQPPSVFEYPRGGHSEKPPEIRTAIEQMYPDFTAATRLELFARETAPGWTAHGFEAGDGAEVEA